MVIKQHEANAFKIIADFYQQAGTGEVIKVSVKNCFDVKWTDMWHAVQHGGNGWEACHPLDEKCMKRQPDTGHEGFLHQQAGILENRIINFLDEVKERNRGTWQHLPVSICAHEFKCWAVGGGDETEVPTLKAMQHPTDRDRAEIHERLMICERCWRNTTNIENMSEFQAFIRLMRNIHSTLKPIHDRWDCFEAQQDVRARIEVLRKHLQKFLKEGLSYCFYVLSDSKLRRGFEPAIFNSCDTEETMAVHNTLRGRLMRELLLDPAVQNCLNDSSLQGGGFGPSFPRLDSGLEELESRFNQGLLTTDVFQDGDSGIVTPNASGMDSQSWNDAWQRFLGMHTALAVIAASHDIFRIMEELSKLGGELFMSAATPKQFVQIALRLCLRAVDSIMAEDGYAHGIEKAISKALLELSTQGKCRKKIPWNQNQEYAEEYFARLKIAKLECVSSIRELQCRIESLTPEELKKKGTERAIALKTLLEATAQRFDGWEKFALTDIDKEVLPDASKNAQAELAPSCELLRFEEFTEEEHSITRKFKHSPLLRTQEGLKPSFEDVLRVILIGRVNSGKTSLMNQILMTGIERQKKEFRPEVPYGMEVDRRGKVLKVEHQAWKLGVQVGWRLVEVKEQPFKYDLLQAAISSGAPAVLTFELGTFPQQVAFLPEDNISNTRVLWHVRRTQPLSDSGPIKVRATFINEAGNEEVFEESAFDNLNEFAEYTLRLSKDLRAKEIGTARSTVHPGEVGHIEVYFPERSSVRIQGKTFEWYRPRVFDHIILIDSPGLGEKLESTNQTTEDIVKTFAHKHACVFVWCIGYDQGAAVTKDCELAVRMSEQVPQAMIVVITKINKALDELQRNGHRGRALQDKRALVERIYEQKNQVEEEIRKLGEAEDIDLHQIDDDMDRLEAQRDDLDGMIQNLEMAINKHQIHENLRTLSERLEQLIRGAKPISFVGNAFCGVDTEQGLDKAMLWALIKTIERRFIQAKQRSLKCKLSELTRLRLNTSNFLTEILNLSHRREVRFLPGESGLSIGNASTSLVSKVSEQSQQLGVKTGWKVLRINDKDFSHRSLQDAERSGDSYCITFQDINCSETPKLLFMRRPEFVEETHSAVINMYNQKVCVELLREVEQNLLTILMEAHEKLLAERGAWRWFDPAEHYVHRLMSNMQQELQRLLKEELELRTVAVREAALRTYRWLCDELPGGHMANLGKTVKMIIKTDEEFRHLMKCLDDHCAVTAHLDFDKQKIPMNSMLVSVYSDGQTESIRTKAALQCHVMPNIHAGKPCILIFDTFLEELNAVRLQGGSIDSTMFSHGSWTTSLLAFGFVNVCGFGAKYLSGIMISEVFGGPMAWLISGLSVAVAVLNHTSYSYEDKRKIVEEHFTDNVIPRFKQIVRDQKQHLQLEVEEVITTVVANFLSARSNAEVSTVSNHSSYRSTLQQAESYLAEIRTELEKEKVVFNQTQKELRDKYNALLDMEERQDNSPMPELTNSVTFQPGPNGFTVLGRLPELLAIEEGGQAERLGVGVNSVVKTINSQDYSESYFRQVVAGEEPYTIVFTEKKSPRDELPSEIHGILLDNICAKNSLNQTTNDIATRPFRIVSPEGRSLLVRAAMISARQSRAACALAMNSAEQIQQLNPIVFKPCICDITNFLLEEFICDRQRREEAGDDEY